MKDQHIAHERINRIPFWKSGHQLRTKNPGVGAKAMRYKIYNFATLCEFMADIIPDVTWISFYDSGSRFEYLVTRPSQLVGRGRCLTTPLTIPPSFVMVEIEIFLSFDGNHVSFLSIPRSVIERLAVFPFRWIRYVMFTICGARGHLLTRPNGPSVDYDKTEIADAENTYYYQPLGKLSFCVWDYCSQCLDFSRRLCLHRLSRFKRPINIYCTDSTQQQFQRQCHKARWTCLCCYTSSRRSLWCGTPDSQVQRRWGKVCGQFI